MTPRQVHFFPTCLVNEAYPEVGFGVARILERQGIRLLPPRLPLCCGQPAFNAGFLDESRSVARATLKAYAGSEGVVLVPSGSCADMLKHHLPTLFEPGSAERAEADRLSGRVRELSQYLVDDLGLLDLGARREAGVAYHPSCHLSRGLGVKDQPLRLLGAVKGLRLLPFPGAEECCGFGGSFSVTHDGLSGAMLDAKARGLQSVQPDYVVSCDLGCLMHLEGGFRRKGWKVKVRHLAQFLAEAL
jgi:L-lactate dehydrogenase complex protein LldE